MAKSRAFTSYGVSAMLRAAAVCIGSEGLRPTNTVQERFLRDLHAAPEDLARCPELRACAFRSPEAMGRFMGARNDEARAVAEPVDGSAIPRLYAASRLSLRWEWTSRATPLQDVSGVEYPGIHHKGVGAFDAEGHEHPIARVDLRNPAGDAVWCTIGPEPADELDLLATVTALRGRARRRSEDAKLTWPAVDLRAEPDIGWIVGLELSRDARVAAAVQRCEIQIDECGGRVEARTSMIVALGFERPAPHIVIDRPFLFWIERPGLALPLVAAWIAQGSWRLPARPAAA